MSNYIFTCKLKKKIYHFTMKVIDGQLFHSFNHAIDGIWWSAKTPQGLYLLNNQDFLTIFDNNNIVWRDHIVKWNYNKDFSCVVDDQHYSHWVYWFPKNCDPQQWIGFFEKGLRVAIGN